MHETFSVCSN